MARKRQRKGFFRSMVDIPTWMGFDSIKSGGENIAGTFNNLKRVSEPQRVETFEEAMTRLALDENSLKKRRRECLMSAWLYLACAVALTIYAGYLLISGHLISVLIALILAGIAGVSAYKEAFWYFQMTVRKLGRTHQEFLAFITGRK